MGAFQRALSPQGQKRHSPLQQSSGGSYAHRSGQETEAGTTRTMSVLVHELLSVCGVWVSSDSTVAYGTKDTNSHLSQSTHTRL